MRGPSSVPRRLSLNKPPTLPQRSSAAIRLPEPSPGARPLARASAPSYAATTHAIQHIPHAHTVSIPRKGRDARSPPTVVVDEDSADEELDRLEAELFQAVDSARTRLTELHDEVNALLSNSQLSRRDYERAEQARSYWQQEALRLRSAASEP